MPHIEEIKDYWNLRASGFSAAVQEELENDSAVQWAQFFTQTLPVSCDVLDDGMGPGFFSVLLARMGHRVTAIDYSDGMVREAQERFAAMGLTINAMQMDAQNLSFPEESFDAVVSRNVIWNLDDPEKAYREIHRVLRHGGKVIIDDGNMYLYHHDEEYAEQHRKFMDLMVHRKEPDGGLHGKHNKDNVDFKIIEKIAEDLPMSYVRRPQWDFVKLVELGFDDIRVEIRGGELPMGFRITAKKRG